MIELINEKVSVLFVYNRETGKKMPQKIRWQGRDYMMTKLGYSHKEWEGKTRIHVFHVNNDTLAFKLKFNTEFLEWHLIEVSDGFAS